MDALSGWCDSAAFAFVDLGEEENHVDFSSKIISTETAVVVAARVVAIGVAIDVAVVENVAVIVKANAAVVKVVAAVKVVPIEVAIVVEDLSESTLTMNEIPPSDKFSRKVYSHFLCIVWRI